MSAYIYAAIALLCAAVGGYATHLYEDVRYSHLQNQFTSYKAQETANDEKTQVEAAAKTMELQQRSDAAEKAYVQEQSEAAAYRDAHPVADVRLCYQAPNGGSMPQATGGSSGASHPSAAPTNVQPVPSRDSGVRTGPGPDVGGLLNFLAARADAVSAQLRGYQAR
jgi:hypothetical protein